MGNSGANTYAAGLGTRRNHPFVNLLRKTVVPYFWNLLCGSRRSSAARRLFALVNPYRRAAEERRDPQSWN